MGVEDMTLIERYDLPYTRKASLHDHEYESGMHLLRLTIREGKRITAVDIGPEQAKAIGQAMLAWAEKQDA
ncbi:MAG: hypothetical protein COB08_007665 [Rhodobacteraceae bacterium]|nr:hypothetical protein [Paracoccaceae bacterium]